jgi:hypothetical protein
MRSAFCKHFLFFVLICGATGAQVNPHTQIRWPAGCSSPNQVYSFQSNSCISIAGINWRGNWSGSTTYAVNDAVAYLGGSYISTASGNTTTPPSSTWQLLSQPGTTGPTGPPGPTFDGGTIHNPLIGTSGSFTSTISAGGTAAPTGFIAGISAAPAFYNPNGEINVMAAGATGDCVTDDHDAIERAILAAAPVGSAQALPLYFPRPPGGCYLTSTLTWQGVSMRGETFGTSSNAVSRLASKAGQDLWLYPDPKDTTTTVYSKSPKVTHMVWLLDDTVDVSTSHPHRKPGRTVYDGVTTSGSRAVTSNTVICSGADVGQGLLITYADTTTQSAVITSCSNGMPGKNMTFASITPAASTTTVIQPLNVAPTPNQIIVASAAGIAVGQVALVPSFPTNQEVTVTAVAGTTITLSAYNQCVNYCNVPNVPAKFYDPTFTATQSQTSTQFYVSLAGISVAETMGNCALAIDNRDGTTTTPSIILNAAHFEDLDIQGKTGTQINKSAGFCMQGVVGLPYGTTWDNVRIGGLVYGLVSYQQDVAPASGSQGGDFNQLLNMNIGSTHPIIWYNGENGRIDQIQTSGTAQTGLQLVGATSTTYAGPLNWIISVPEQEQGTGTVNLRLEGRGHVVTNLGTSASGATMWAASNSKCISCAPRGTQSGTPGWFTVTGVQNDIEISDSINLNPIADDLLNGNRITGLRSTSGSNQLARPIMFNQQRECKTGANSANFLFGSAAEPYLNNCDLWFWPQDLTVTGGVKPGYVADPTVQTGYYLSWGTAVNGASFNGVTGPQPLITIGKNVPAKKVAVYIQAKCPTQVSFTITPRVLTPSGTNTALTAQAITCSSSWAVLPATMFIADLTAYSGYHFNLQITGITDEVDIAWFALVPLQDNYNGYTPENIANKNAANGYAGLDGSGNITAPVTAATRLTTHGTALQAWTTAGDGVTQQWGTVGGTIPNTLGCLQGFDTTPCVIAKLGTTYSSTSSSGTTTWYTNTTGGAIKVHFMGMSHTTVVGTAGTMQLELGVTGQVNQCVGNSSVSITSTATKFQSSVNANGCTAILQNGEILSWTLLLTGATGSPTMEIYAYVERLE